MNNKIVLTIFILLIAAAFLTGCMKIQNTTNISNTQPVQEKIVKIRVTAPLTGSYAYYGTQVQRALSLSLEDNADKLKSAGIHIDIKYEDNTGDKTVAVSNFNEFVSEGNVPIIISTNTPLSQPLIRLAEQNKINFIALVTGAKDFAKNTTYVFRDAIMSYDEGVLMARYLVKMNITRISTIVVNDDYGLSGATGIKDEFTKLGGTVLSQEVFENSASDMRSQITKIEDKNPQAIFLAGREANLIASVKQMNELGINSNKIYSIDSFESPTVINGLGNASNNIVITSDYFDLNDSGTKQFFDEFHQNYGAEPGIYAIDAYSAGQYLVQSIIDCGVQADQINSCLSTRTFSTIKGELNYNQLHDAKITVGIFSIYDSKKILIEKLN